MGLFFCGYDYTLCDASKCQKRNRCKRYLTYQKARAEKYPYMLSVHRPKNVPKDCTMFEPID